MGTLVGWEIDVSGSEPATGVPVQETSPGPWGFWATTGLGLAIVAVFFLVQIVTAIPYTTIMGDASPQEAAAALNASSVYVATSLLATGVLATLVILLFARLRKGIGVRDYLAIHLPGWRSLAMGLVVVIVAMVALEGVNSLLDREAPEWVVALYGNVDYPLLLALGLVVGAPLFEEAFFRGFLFAGWSRSRLGVTGTIVLTSALWAAMHMQYGAFEIAQIFLLGVILGYARHRSGSLIVPLAMHALVNLAAHLQMMYVSAV